MKATIKKVLLYFDVMPRLGLRNVAYVAWYRFTLKTGLRKIFFPHDNFDLKGDLYRKEGGRTDFPENWKSPLVREADKIVSGRIRYYGRHWKSIGSPPDWFLNPFKDVRFQDNGRHWVELKDFDLKVGDIKNIWEASRFEWVTTLTRAYAATGKTIYIDTVNHWIKDWADKNPLNIGPNWKCGQEASIRVFNLINASLILDQWEEPESSLQEYIHRHLERINGNVRYALAQDNNHGTSEAAALFIGGNWLQLVSDSPKQKKEARRYARRGRKLLENRVKKLVGKDGSFSQHSVTYHRVLLDTLFFAEFWRKKLDIKPFSDVFYERFKAALNWLIFLTDEDSGDAPNLGSNDGALFFSAHGCDYRNFRPSIQAVSIMLDGDRMYEEGPWDEPIYWFGLASHIEKKKSFQKYSKIFGGGYAVLKDENSWALVRFPQYRFRPAHNDALHFDLWYNGKNICRDGGSYSYNSGDPKTDDFFKSVKAHNTACFDGKEQMLRIGRFLPAKWPRTTYVSNIEQGSDGKCCWTAAYADYRGNSHRRKVSWHDDEWTIEDLFDGDFKNVILSFRLVNGNYGRKGKQINAPWGKISIEAPGCEVTTDKIWESRYYREKAEIDVLHVLGVEKTNRVLTRFSLTMTK